MDIKKTSDLNSSKGWIQRLKEESWEAELLVSAIAIFGTFKLFDIIGWATNNFINLLHPNQYLIGYFITFFGLIALSVLASMFLIHFFLRAYWIGLVGLNSVFPDYSIEDSAYSKIYTQKILSILPKLTDSIKKVDELCSVIFSVAFTFLLMYGYMSIFASIYLLIYNLLSDYIPHYILLLPAIIGAVLMLVQMTLTIISNLKSNKENEKIQTFSFQINQLANFMLFGPLYKAILQVSMIFGSNFKKKKSLVHLVLTFILLGIFVTGYQIKNTNILYLANNKKYFNSTKIYASFYKESNVNNTFLLSPEIASDKISSEVLKMFIPVFKHEEGLRTTSCDTLQIDKEATSDIKRRIQTDNFLNCIDTYYHIFIDDQKVAVDFLRQNAHARTKQAGVISYVDVSHLTKGIHTIEIKKEYGNVSNLNWKIPFYYLPRKSFIK